MRSTVNIVAGLAVTGLTAVMLVGGCATIKPGSARLAPGALERVQPTGTQVKWANNVCQATASLANLRSDYENITSMRLPAPLDTGAQIDVDLAGYVGYASFALETAASTFGAIKPVGDAATDGVLRGLQQEIDRVQSEVQRSFDPMSMGPSPSNTARAAALDELLDSLPAPERELVPVARRDPLLAKALTKATECRNGPVSPAQQPKALPTAEDGTDISACRDGDCAVRISGETELVVADLPVLLAVRNNSVTTSTNFGADDGGGAVSQVGAGGEVGFGSGGTDVTIRVQAIKGRSAVVDISAEK